MWGFASNAIASIGLKSSKEASRSCSERSDDEVYSNGSRDEGLECPICWESFNIVENVPYVLWCGHTLCQNCILGLQPAVLKIRTQQIKIPLFVSCPWCHFLSLRFVYKGILKFPRKNFFLLWMIESLNGDRYGVVRRTSSGDYQPVGSPRCNLMLGNQVTMVSLGEDHMLIVLDKLGLEIMVAEIMQGGIISHFINRWISSFTLHSSFH
ncbi:hypothetical protein CRYUN_Cryun06bG0166300 [Craigia yunnanensis]